jgi:beta,beta-carotene 9',10'-dioxygenase
MASSPTPTVAATTPVGGFTSLERELSEARLPVRGELPPWLHGSLLRTGPAKWEIGERRLNHWFDGLAMLHRFTFAAGRVSYANRFLDSRTYRIARDSGRLAFRQFATDPCRSLFQRVHSLFAPEHGDNGNVNLARLGERFIAMTESPLPVEFDARTLAAAGVPFAAPGELSIAHPHVDRASGRLLSYAAKLGARSEYRFFSVAPESARPVVIASLPVREPAYMHSFGLTERWFVLAEFPLVVNPLRLAASARTYIENYRWKPELGTRITLVDRQTRRHAGPFTTDALFAFHHVNAYEDGDDVVIDLCAYADPGLIEDLYMARLRAGRPVRDAELRRLRLTPASGDITHERLVDEPIELPRVNYEYCNERAHRYVWGTGTGGSGWFDRIVKADVAIGACRTWAEPGCYPGEPVFAPRPEPRAEDDGVLLSVVFDARRGTSFLLVLDADDLAELARAEVPHHIPFGFHGQYADA